MSEINNCITNTEERKRKKANNNIGNAVYGFGFIGAAIYFIQHATTFWFGVLGFLKALIWPVLVVYKILEFLKL